MRFVLAALVLASAAIVCAFALFSKPQIRIAPPEGSVTRVVVDLLKKMEAMQPVDTLIHAAALKHRVPAALVKSIVAAESNFRCDAVSPKGAIGLMQLMPATAQEF